MRVIRITAQGIEHIKALSHSLSCTPGIVAVRFLVPDDFTILPAFAGNIEEVTTPQGEAPKEKPAKGRRGYPSVKVEITGTLAEKLRAYSGTDAFMISVIDSWKKWGKLSPGQIFWIEKKLGA